MLVVPIVLQIGHLYCTAACDRHAFSNDSTGYTKLAARGILQLFLPLLSLYHFLDVFWMSDDTVAGGGWGGGNVEEEDTGSGLGGPQATSGSGWGQAEPDQVSLVHLDLQFAALVRCSGRKAQVCLVITDQS